MVDAIHRGKECENIHPCLVCEMGMMCFVGYEEFSPYRMEEKTMPT
jgi:hypothetical protein